MGRPSIHTPELAAEICRRLEAGESLRSICRRDGMPSGQCINEWIQDNREGFGDQYAIARNNGLDAMAEQTLDIADDVAGDPARDRLRVDTRKWYLSKLAPKRYGEKLIHEGGDTPVRMSISWEEPDDA